MRLKRELKHLWYFLVALVLFSATVTAYVVILWALPLVLLFLIFTKIAATSGAFVTSTIIISISVFLMWVLKNNPRFPFPFFAWITHLLGAPARYGIRLLDRISQEDMTPDRDK